MNNKEKQLANYPLGNAIIHNMVKGGFAGCAEVLVSGQILWALKARLQAGEPFTMNPMILYRGLMPHLLGRLPITAAQITGAEITMGVLSRKRNDLTLTDRAAGAVVGGMAAAVFNAPAETIMLEQQKRASAIVLGVAKAQKSLSASEATRHLVSRYGWSVLMTGYVGSAIRLATYNGVIFCGVPVLGQWIQQKTELPQPAAKMMASLFSSLFAVFVSNPADLAKTLQQAHIDKQRLSLTETVRQEVARSGWTSLWKGFGWRYARVAAGAFVIDKANTIFNTFTL